MNVRMNNTTIYKTIIMLCSTLNKSFKVFNGKLEESSVKDTQNSPLLEQGLMVTFRKH